MKQQIRQGVFETNSSSTHALAILSDEEYQEYRDGQRLISRDGEIITKDEYNERLEVQKVKSKKHWDESDWCQKEYPDFEEYWKKCYDGPRYEFDDNNMEIIHSERELDGKKVHALSVYGYEC